MTEKTQTKRLFWIILILGLVIRLVLAYFQYSGDIKNHFVWGNGFLENPVDFYSRHFAGYNDPNYPPLAIIFFAAANLLHQAVSSFLLLLNRTFSFFPSFIVPLIIHENTRFAFLKLPGIIADIFTFTIIYKFLTKQKSKRPLLLASLYLFNPAVIYISSVWGQIEPLTNLFLVWSLYIALYSPLRYFSILVFALGVLTKQTTLWFGPLYLILWLKQLTKDEIFRGLVLSLGAFFASFLLFRIGPSSAISIYFQTLSGSSTLVSDAAWNIWHFLFPPGTEDAITIKGISVRSLSIFILFSSLFYLIIKELKNFSMSRFLNHLFIWSLLVFFIQTRVHERHLAPAILFCLLTPGLFSRYLLDFFVLSAYHMYNLYWSLRLPFI
ncbi:MAG: hypothetical protein WA052_02700 [Microgenomates group bacterium]